jgi:hydroxymethylbilane synthase
VKRTFVIGTRGSRLALRQTDIVRDLLRAAHPGARVEVREIRTEGDVSTAPLSMIGGAGVFTKAIEDALLAGAIDIAVHSLKDLPPQIASGLAIAAIPERGDARDALVTRDGRGLSELPRGARVGTGSARRAVQLLALRPDLEVADIRGNVDTRVRKVEEGNFDAAILALAGLQRLGLESKAAQVFSPFEITPSVGQGCLVVEVREDDREALEVVTGIDHAVSRRAADAERAFLARLGAGCRLPVGAHTAPYEGDDVLRLFGMMAAGSPPRILRASEQGRVADAARIGERLAQSLIDEAGGDYLDAAS